MPTGFDMNSFDDPEPLIDDAAWDLLSAYVDGETTPEEAHQVEERLKADSHYLNAYNMLRATSVVAQDLGEIEPPATLRAGILAATTQRRVSTLATLSRYALAAGAVAAAAAVLGFFFMPGRRMGMGYTPNPTVAMNLHPEVTLPLIRHFAPEPHMTVKAPERHSSQGAVRSPRDEAKSPDTEIAPEDLIQVTPASMKTPVVSRSSVHEKHRSITPGATHSRPNSPVPDSGTSGVDTSQGEQVAYTPRPMVADFRPTSSDIVTDAHTDEQPIRTADEDVSHSDGSAGVTPAVQTSEAQAPRVRFARMLRSQLASNSPALLTGADIKRIRDASMYGFDRPNTETLPHRDAAALVVGRF